MSCPGCLSVCTPDMLCKPINKPRLPTPPVLDEQENMMRGVVVEPKVGANCQRVGVAVEFYIDSVEMELGGKVAGHDDFSDGHNNGAAAVARIECGFCGVHARERGRGGVERFENF